MSEKKYDPRAGIRGATKAMNAFVRKSHPTGRRDLTLSTNDQPVPCAVLLKSFVEDGPVPDDFKGLPKSSQSLKDHVRPDGAVYKGAFQLQGTKDSVILMYGPKNLTETRAEQIANMERLALTQRHASFVLGPFAARPEPSSRADRPSLA